jgi:hypothetical protein
MQFIFLMPDTYEGRDRLRRTTKFVDRGERFAFGNPAEMKLFATAATLSLSKKTTELFCVCQSWRPPYLLGHDLARLALLPEEAGP